MHLANGHVTMTNCGRSENKKSRNRCKICLGSGVCLVASLLRQLATNIRVFDSVFSFFQVYNCHDGCSKQQCHSYVWRKNFNLVYWNLIVGNRCGTLSE